MENLHQDHAGAARRRPKEKFNMFAAPAPSNFTLVCTKNEWSRADQTRELIEVRSNYGLSAGLAAFSFAEDFLDATYGANNFARLFFPGLSLIEI